MVAFFVFFASNTCESSALLGARIVKGQWRLVVLSKYAQPRAQRPYNDGRCWS